MKSQNCVHHKKQFNYYCETCEEPICHLCTTLGPHNYNVHRINQLQESFKSRVSHYSQEIKYNLLPKREEILAQIHRIEYRIEEIKYVALLIERDCKAEQNGMVDRLAQVEGAKIAKLQHQMHVIQQDLDDMNDIGLKYMELIKQDKKVDLLYQSKDIIERIEFLIAKPYNKAVDEIADDLPKELTDLRVQIGKIDAQKQIIEIYNELIWKLMNEKKLQEDFLNQQLIKDADTEIKEWVKLVDFFTEQLKEHQLVCYFCNKPITQKRVNKKCKINIKQPLEQVSGFTKEKPNDSQMGSGRHFFGHPKDSKQRPIMIKQKKPSAVLIETIISKIRIKIQEDHIKLSEIFSNHDDEKNGSVTEIVFCFILQDKLGLIDEDIEAIMLFIDQREVINFNILLNMINSNQFIQSLVKTPKQKSAK
ncbi:hypothetical protein pb186bvf_008938 [Paramecium bursaria]